jgi:hypothetical protein
MQTCSAPMPAFPRVHIDGAVANALARAFLQRVETTVIRMQYSSTKVVLTFTKNTGIQVCAFF